MANAWRPHPQFPYIALCDGPDGLVAIHKEFIQAVIWERATPQSILVEARRRFVQACPQYAEHLFHVQMPVSSDVLMNHLYGVACHVMRALTSNLSYLEIRCEHGVSKDGRRQRTDLFHYDTGNRCIIPLVGAPTQWIPYHAPWRRRCASEKGVDERFIAPQEWVQELPNDCVVLYKGMKSSMPFLHRTPPGIDLRCLGVINPY